MRVLLVVPACPHPFGDTAAKWFDVLIREMVRRGHHVDLVCVTEEADDRIAQSSQTLGAVDGPGTLTVSIQRLTISRQAVPRKLYSLCRPFSEIEQADGVRRLVDTRLTRCDVLHLEQLWTGWLADGVAHSLLNVHHLETIDMEHERPRSWVGWKTRWQTHRGTAAILNRAHNVRFFTPRLADRARTHNRSARHWVVPFALEPSHYHAVVPPADPVVGLIGSMQWRPSRSAAERLITRIWPKVRAAVPATRLLVAGWNAERVLQRFATTSGLELCSNLSHPREFFARTSVLAYAPGRGSGMKIKVMEAMAFGVPVVTTAEGVEGLAVTPGVHAHVAEDDERLAAHVIELLRDRVTAARMSRAARALIQEQYNPRIVVDRMVEIYDRVAAG